jgi:hypothetical protein
MASGEFINFGPIGDLQMNQVADADQQEIIEKRERFAGPVSLDKNAIFCVDDRPSDQEDMYVHWLGGILDPVYSVLVMQEMTRPGSVKGSLADSVRSVMPVIVRASGVQYPGVHSDDASEGGRHELNTAIAEGIIGCGYALNRQAISEQNFSDAPSLIAVAKQKRPELFESTQDDEYAHSFVAAHERLTHREGFLGSGRGLVLAAVKAGALSMIVQGKHEATQAIYNLDPETTIGTTAAAKADLDVYVKDAGLIERAYDGIRKVYPYDKRALMIGDLIDTISTFRLLGIDDQDIAVRRAA